jgi:hypothetical protein
VLSVLSYAQRDVPAYHLPIQPLTQGHLSIHHVDSVEHLQSPTSNSYSNPHPSNRAKHRESREAHQESRVHVSSKIQSHKSESHSELQRRLTFIMSPPHNLIPSTAQATLPDSSAKAKQSEATKCQISRAAHVPRRADAFQNFGELGEPV